MAELIEEQKQEAAANTQQEQQEAAPTQPPVESTPARSGPAQTGETPEDMKSRLNNEAKLSRERTEVAENKATALEQQLAKLTEANDAAKKEAARAEMSAIEIAEDKAAEATALLVTERNRTNDLVLEQTASQYASEAGFRNPSMVGRLLDKLTAVKDGNIDLANVKSQVDDIAAKNEYMLNKPPPAKAVGPTNNPSEMVPVAYDPAESVNLKSGQDASMARSAQVLEAEKSMRTGTNPLAAREYVDAFMKKRNESADARSGRLWNTGAIPKEERSGPG